MKNFKIFLVETLIQLTILVSISRYQHQLTTTTTNEDPFQELLQKSLVDFERHNFLQHQQQPHHHNTDFNHLFDRIKEDFNFDFEDYLNKFEQQNNNQPTSSKDFLNFNSIDKTNQYLENIISHNSRRRQQLNIFLNPNNFYLRVTDKFLEYPELQTKNSLISFWNNANISPEDMNAVKRILFEQDADLGVDRSFYDPEYRSKTSSYEKNYTNKDDLELLVQSNKPTFVFKSPKIARDEELLLIPEGYQKIVEEDTGEVFFIPTEQSVKHEIPSEPPVIFEPKLTPESEFNALNPVALERYSSNKGSFDELNDTFLDDLSFLNTPPPDVKIDDAWMKNFMEPTSQTSEPQIVSQQPEQQTEGLDLGFNNFFSSFTPNSSLDAIDKGNDVMFPPMIQLTQPDTQQQQQQNLFNSSAITTVNTDEYLNSIDTIIDDLLLDGVDNRTQIMNIINSNQFYNFVDENVVEVVDSIGEIDFDQNLSTSSSILSNSSANNTLLENQIVIKEEATSQDALYGFMHNHTYLESNNDDVYHPHSYKNKLKNMINATNRESKDEALLLEYRISYSLDSIINSNVEVFSDMLKDPSLSPDQLNIMRDIRRRGKNKIAAKTCRKRKIDSIDGLKEDVDELRKKKRTLELEREKIQEQMKQFASKISTIYKDLTGSNQDPSDPIKNYIENLLTQLNERTGDQLPKSSKNSSDRTPRYNNKRK